MTILTQVSEALRNVLTVQADKLGKSTGFIKRQVKVTGSWFAQTLVFGWLEKPLLKTALFVSLMLLVGAKVMPWLLLRIAHTRSRELFILAVVALALGTALGAAEWFGVSLALGAFLAGVVIGESTVSHQVGAEILPFRDIFAVLFFVSVGMLVNPLALLGNIGQVLALTLLIVVGKGLFTLLIGLLLPASGRTVLVVAVGLSQIGEFSFLVGQAGLALGVLTQQQYGLILAGALFSIVINPLLFKSLPAAERQLQRAPRLWRWLEKGGPTPQLVVQSLANHVVVVGYGRVGEHIVTVLERLAVPCMVVERDVARALALQQRGVAILYGDAANSEVLTHAHLAQAQALVVTVPDETTAELVVTTAQDLAPALPIIARAASVAGCHRLTQQGAQVAIQPELEGGLEIVRHTLLALEYPLLQVQLYMDAVRQDRYDTTHLSPEENRILDQLVTAVRGMELVWQRLAKDSPLLGQTLAQANLRAQTGASIVALVRDQQVIANPEANTIFAADDQLQIVTGQTLYVPAYSEIFYGSTDRKTALAVTLAIHNTDLDAPIIIQSVQYFDTNGQLVRDYVRAPVQVAPLATTGFLVEAGDQRGGWGKFYRQVGRRRTRLRTSTLQHMPN